MRKKSEYRKAGAGETRTQADMDLGVAIEVIDITWSERLGGLFEGIKAHSCIGRQSGGWRGQQSQMVSQVTCEN
jgi:hypothetical protein